MTISGYSQGIDFDAGIKAGVNLSKLTGLYADSKTGHVYGVFIEVKFKNNVGIQAEGLYAQQNSSRGDWDLEMTYFKVPLVCKYHTSNKFNFYAGPQLGFVMKDNIEEQSMFPNGDSAYSSEPIDISGVFGIGYEIIKGLGVDARLSFGTTDVFKSTDRPDLLIGAKTLVYTASIQYSFL